MKKIKKLLLANMFLFFGLSNILAQTTLNTHTIMLNVDTSKITKGTVNKYSNFGQITSISNEAFTIEAAVGETIVWVGKSTTSVLDEVIIHSINYQSGVEIFDKNILKSQNNSTVIGSVSQGKVGDLNKYDVKFRVRRKGVKVPGIFVIDPKIRIRQWYFNRILPNEIVPPNILFKQI